MQRFYHLKNVGQLDNSCARLMKNINFKLSLTGYAFHCLSSLILLFAFVMKIYLLLLFIRTFILIGHGQGRVGESTYMVMFIETKLPVLREVSKKKAFFKQFCAILLTQNSAEYLETQVEE